MAQNIAIEPVDHIGETSRDRAPAKEIGQENRRGRPGSCRLAGCQAQARDEKLSVLRVSQIARIWSHKRGNGP